jgi:hypothetical protein
MKKAIILILLLLLMIPNANGMRLVRTFADGTVELTGTPPEMGNVTGNLSLPRECYVLDAHLNLSISGTGCADNLSVGNKTIWAFGGKGLGRYGCQDSFSDGLAIASLAFPRPDVTKNFSVYLPKNCIVNAAQMQVTASGEEKYQQLFNNTGYLDYKNSAECVAGGGDVDADGYGDFVVGRANSSNSGSLTVIKGGDELSGARRMDFGNSTSDDYFGLSLAMTDLNGDGYDDIIVGAKANHTVAGTWGAVLVYFGGERMHNSSDHPGFAPDMVLRQGNGFFGTSVAKAGDVNGDGYDDLIVGAPNNSTGADAIGSAYVYFGGPQLDDIADVTIKGHFKNDFAGGSVDGIGDINGDGYDDLIVGAAGSIAAIPGRARIYLGGPAMDNVTDLELSEGSVYDAFGYSVSGAGDVNGDGIPDIIIGAPDNQTGGQAYIFYGGWPMSGKPDVLLTGDQTNDGFGFSVSGAGDQNQDGFDDVVVGAPWGADKTGSAYLCFGGSPMDSTKDIVFNGEAKNDKCGYSVSGCLDLNRDGRDDFIVGAVGYVNGHAYVYTHSGGVRGIIITLNGSHIFYWQSILNSTCPINWSWAVNYNKAKAPVDFTDAYGNDIVKLTYNVTTWSEGTVNISALDFIYNGTATTKDFSPVLNNFIQGYRGSQVVAGNLSVPLRLSGDETASLKIDAVNITLDDAPQAVSSIPESFMYRDSGRMLFNLRDYFRDDIDPAEALEYAILPIKNASVVNLSVLSNQYLFVDAFNGSANDGWAGVVSGRVVCTDTRGSRTMSNEFLVNVLNNSHAPIISSLPVLTADIGSEYTYQVMASDPASDPLRYSLVLMPKGMHIDPIQGNISWVPAYGGSFDICLAVAGGPDVTYQNFTIKVNRPPGFQSTPVPYATVGIEYVYNVSAIDPDNDHITYYLCSTIEGMRIDSQRVSWVPEAEGNFSVSILALDGRAAAYQNFTIEVFPPGQNLPPWFSSTPDLNAMVGMEWVYFARATDPDGDALTYTLVTEIPGMQFDPSTGLLKWTPLDSQVGRQNIMLRVSDGRGGVAEQNFTITVIEQELPAMTPRCNITEPLQGAIVRGHLVVKGVSNCGQRQGALVQVRVDGSDWGHAVGIETWIFEVDTLHLKNGMHRIEAIVIDGQNNSQIVSVDVRVNNNANSAPNGGRFPVWLTVALAVIILAIVVIVLLIARFRRKTVVLPNPSR